MKKLQTVFLSLFLTLILQAQNAGYQIPITLKPYKNVFVYLAYHYGDKKAIADSAWLNEKSEGVFKGKESLHGGIYMIVSPQKQILFELLLDGPQRFSILADTVDLARQLRFVGSPENSRFQQYIGFANQLGKESALTQEQLKRASSSKDSMVLQYKLRSFGASIKTYRDSIEKKYPASLLTVLFKAMKDPQIPPAHQHPGGKYDTAFAYRYFKNHYWDGISFDDERMIRTPFFEAKLNRYFKDLVAPAPDSIIPEVDHMILYSRPSKEMFKYFLVYFVQKYVNPEFMGQDEVFVHLFEKYVNTGQTDFFTEQYKDYITKRAYSVMANLIGRPASELDMVDSMGVKRNLYSIQSPLTLVCFWDPTCGHCKETVPRIDSAYQASWKAKGVRIYGVKTDGGRDQWSQFIKEKKLEEWIHVYELPETEEAIRKAGKPSFRQLYDVYQTPILYLLDKDKRIIGKKLTVEQLDEVIRLKTQNKL